MGVAIIIILGIGVIFYLTMACIQDATDRKVLAEKAEKARQEAERQEKIRQQKQKVYEERLKNDPEFAKQESDKRLKELRIEQAEARYNRIYYQLQYKGLTPVEKERLKKELKSAKNECKRLHIF